MTSELHVGQRKPILVTTILENHWKSLILSLVLTITNMLKKWTRRLFMTNNEKKKREFKRRRNQLSQQKTH